MSPSGPGRPVVVLRGYRRPIVCPRVYRQVAPALDPNGNRVACERR